MNLNGYNLHRAWYNFVFDNPGIVRTQHTSLYLFIVETCNRLGWKRNFGLPTNHAMEGSSIGNYQTFRKTFDDLVKWGFIKLIQKSKNQYSANVVALCNTEAAKSSAMDRALMNQCKGTEDIVKPQTSKTLNNKKMSEIEISEVPYEEREIFKYGTALQKVILNIANQKNVPLKKVENTTYITWMKPLKFMIEKDQFSIKDLRSILNYLEDPENEFWRKTILDTKGLRKNSSKILTEINSTSKPSIVKIPTDDSLTSKLESYE